MAIVNVKRTIIFAGKKLKDVPGKSPEQIKQLYSAIYPQLITASIKQTEAVGEITIEFENGFQSKGHE
jgi:PRTRC genetic system protein C